MTQEKPVRVYRNEDVERIAAFIPRGHMHTRLILVLKDQVIVLQEATVAAIVRAYASVALHPSRRAVELERRRLAKGERKPLFAEHQLVETNRAEEEVLEWAEELLGRAAEANKGETP